MSFHNTFTKYISVKYLQSACFKHIIILKVLKDQKQTQPFH